MKIFSITIWLAIICSLLGAQALTEAMTLGQEQVIPDSLALVRERDIASEYGFKDSDQLQEVAAKLEIEDVDSWKRYLKLEVENTQLDGKTLRQLGISPYQALLALQSSIYGINELNTVTETATKLNIPVKKFKELVGLNPLDRSSDHASLQVVGKSPEEIIAIKKDFDEHRILYGSSITFVGMLVVFSSLALSSLIISQLVHLNKRPKTETNVITISKSGKVKKAPDGLSQGVIVAAISALHIHVQSIEERRRLLLTFKRTPLNLWRASNVTEMPNRSFKR